MIRPEVDHFNSLESRTAEAAAGVLSLAATAIRFAQIERVPRYSTERRENDAEHSFMLAIVAPELALAFYPHLNIALVHQYATFHDLIELETEGDTATYALDTQALEAKENLEHTRLPRLLAKSPPYMASMIRAYESQEDPESRFVRCVDKLLPLATDIIGPGSQVMHEDYDVTTHLKLSESQAIMRDRIATRFGDEFPELVDIHAFLSCIFKDVFIEAHRQQD